MVLKLRITTHDGNVVSGTSTAVELLKVLLDFKNGIQPLSQEEEDSLRGWLLLRAQELEMGKTSGLEGQPDVSIGKTADGRPYVHDITGDWPPVKPDFD